MAKPKRKLTKEEKCRRQQRKKEYQTVFVNGKQVRVKRPPTIEGMSVEEYLVQNADPIWLHLNGMWEYIEDVSESTMSESLPRKDDEIPF